MRFVSWVVLFLTTVSATMADEAASGAQGWRAGVASVKITPERALHMAGYAARKEPAAGTSHAAPDEMNYANGGIDKGASDGVGVVALASASTRRRAAVAGLRAIAQLQSAPGAAAPALLSRRLAN